MMWFKGVAKYTPYPYAVTSANCTIWLVYGIRRAMGHNQSAADASTTEKLLNSGVAWVNGIGVALELLYIVLFFIYSPAHDRRRKPLFIAMAGGVIAVIVGGAAFAINPTLASFYCAFCGLAVYAVPLYDVVCKLTTHSSHATSVSLS
jgi:solute carrier family 50 protein (sugar transporter)